MTAVLELKNVVKNFPIRSSLTRRAIGQVSAVDRVSLSVASGETLGLVGESGSGKTTLGRLALRLIKPTSGHIVLNGRDVSSLSVSQMRPLRRSIQMVFQDPYSSLDPHATIESNVGEPLHTHLGLRGRRRSDRVGELLDRVGLGKSCMSRYPHEFSGGQLQRIALARALALNPSIVVADEPVSSLDVSTQAQIVGLLQELQRADGVAYLFISHDVSVVSGISARVAVMYLGRIMEIGKRQSVVGSPQHPYTQALLAAVPVPTPTRERKPRTMLGGDPPSPANPPPGCRFHTRCPYVMEICRAVEPAGSVTATGSTVFCHLYSTAGDDTRDASVIAFAAGVTAPPGSNNGAKG